MIKTLYTVYWTQGSQVHSHPTWNMAEAMKLMEVLRKDIDASAIVMAAEHADQVGKMGVDTIKDGILPDGQEYVYKTGRDRGRDPR